MNTKSTLTAISPQICKSLVNMRVVAFVRELIKKSYRQFYNSNIPEVNKMVDEAFDLLISSQRQPGMESLVQAIQQLHRTVFVQSPDHWFYKTYKNYKVAIRPEEDYKKISSYINGPKVLDIGAGAGYFAVALKRHGYDVTAMDVLDYRNGNAQEISFIKMGNATEIPVEGVYDTAFLKTVLHHISFENIPVLLSNIRKKAKRIIIEEDVFGLTQKDAEHINLSQPDFDFFCTLNESDQKDMLILMDFFGNIIIYGIDDMNLPFEFKTLSEWEDLFKKVGWNLIAKNVVGFDETRIHRPCQVWFICD